MNNSYYLQDISLIQSPGFGPSSFPRIENLGPSLNVIWGPNAIGKSTLSRAMRAILWNTPSGKHIIATGTLYSPSSLWKLQLNLGHLEQIRLDGNKNIPLPGRNDELSDSYWFPLHELLQEKDGNADTFLQVVLNQMQGGIDIKKATIDSGGSNSFTKSNNLLTKKVRMSEQRVKEIIKDQKEYRNIQDEIVKIEKEIEESKELTQQKNTIIEAQVLLETLTRIQELQKKLERFHPSIEYITLSSYSRLNELKSIEKSATKDLNDMKDEKERLLQELASCSVTDEQINDINFTKRLQTIFDECNHRVGIRKECEKEFIESSSTLDEWESQHSWLIANGPKEALLKDHITALKQLAAECEPIRCKVDAASRFLSLLGKEEEILQDTNKLKTLLIRTSDFLTLWYTHKATSKYAIPNRKKATIALLISAILLLGITPMVSFSHPLISIGTGIIALILFVISNAAFTHNSEYKRLTEQLNESQKELEKMLTTLNFTLPRSWDAKQLTEILFTINEMIEHNSIAQQRNEKIRNQTIKVEEARDELSTWSEKWKEAVRALNLPIHEGRLEGAQFFHFAQRLDYWSTYKIHKKKAKDALKAARDKENEAILQLQKELDSDTDDFTELKVMSESLIQRVNESHALHKQLTSVTTRIKILEKNHEASLLAIDEFYKSIHIPCGDEVRVKELTSQVSEYNELIQEISYLTKEYERRASVHPSSLELSTTTRVEDLDTELNLIEKKLEEVTTLSTILGGLQATYKRLTSSHELSTSEQEYQAALGELDELREKEVMQNMIYSISKSIQEESEHTFHPQVLTEASNWLEQITNYHYTLSANDDGFFVTDTVQMRNFKVDELSSGTKIQLLFSIRMAFITLQEETSGVRLPIFLDELLANSDDEKAHHITNIIATIAKERQVFYFTAQRDEVEKLTSATNESITVIQLEDTFRGFKRDNAPLISHTYTPTYLPPVIENYYEYGNSLSVPSPSLFQSIESLHSWHFFKDSVTLSSYLMRGLGAIGQIMASLHHHKDPVLEQRFSLLQRAQSLTRIGRCRVLTKSDLNDPELPLNRNAGYWDQIIEVVGEDGVKGKELLEAIEDKRIQRLSSSYQEVLTNWLMGNEFITEQVPKRKDEILSDLFVKYRDLLVNSENHEIVERWIDSVLHG